MDLGLDGKVFVVTAASGGLGFATAQALVAAGAGVLVVAASIVAGGAESWFVLHRLDSALQYIPRLTRLLGARRAARPAAA